MSGIGYSTFFLHMDVQLFHNHLLKHLLPFFIELPCICVKNKLYIFVLFFSFLLKIFIYFTLSVLVVACRIFIMSCRIFSCGAQILVVAHRVSCSEACGIFPNQGSNLCLLHWQVDSLPLSRQGSPVLSLSHI